MMPLAETLARILLGLIGITSIGLGIWVAMRDVEIPRVGKWSLVVGAFAVSTFFMEFVAWLLIVLMMITAAVLPIRFATGDRRIRRSCLFGVLLWIGISLFPASYFFGMATFERAISRALKSEVDPDASGRIRWQILRNHEDTSWLRKLPPVADVRCPQRLFPDGACCLIDYPDGRRSEIHIFRSGFRRYTVRKLTAPSFGLCRNPGFEPTAVAGTPEADEWVRCDVLWRSPPPAQDRAPNDSY